MGAKRHATSIWLWGTCGVKNWRSLFLRRPNCTNTIESMDLLICLRPYQMPSSWLITSAKNIYRSTAFISFQTIVTIRQFSYLQWRKSVETPWLSSPLLHIMMPMLGCLSFTTRASHKMWRMSDISNGGSPHALLVETTWNSRAWAFQELLLSPRSLIFLEEQAYWRRNSADWFEDLDFDHPSAPFI